jgi:hypothetical protein
VNLDDIKKEIGDIGDIEDILKIYWGNIEDIRHTVTNMWNIKKQGPLHILSGAKTEKQ